MFTRLYQMFLKVNKTDDGIPKDKDPIILWGTRGAGNITFFANVASGQPGTWAKDLLSRLVLVIVLLSKGQKTSQGINNRCTSCVYRNGACFQAQNQLESPLLRIQHSRIYVVKPQRNKTKVKMTPSAVIGLTLRYHSFKLQTKQSLSKIFKNCQDFCELGHEP